MVIFIKKIVVVSIIAFIAVFIIGFFSVNYIFDTILGKDLMNEIGISDDLAVAPENDVTSEADIESGSSDEYVEDKTDPKIEENINTEQLEKIVEQISIVDKAKVINIVKNNISAEDVKTLSSLASDGFEQEELQQVKQLLMGRVSEEEIVYLKSLYEKYNH